MEKVRGQLSISPEPWDRKPLALMRRGLAICRRTLAAKVPGVIRFASELPTPKWAGVRVAKAVWPRSRALLAKQSEKNDTERRFAGRDAPRD